MIWWLSARRCGRNPGPPGREGKARGCCSEDSPVTSVQQLAGMTVATEFPVITRRYFANLNVKVTIVLVGGACEATPHLGIADAIVDLSSSGTPLKTNVSGSSMR